MDSPTCSETVFDGGVRVPVNLLGIPPSDGHKGCPRLSCCGAFVRLFVIGCSLQGASGQRQSELLDTLCPESGGKTGKADY